MFDSNSFNFQGLRSAISPHVEASHRASDMQDNIQSGCNGHKFTDDVEKWCILNETVGQM